ncbi:hypothetical protein BDN72DRAFT_830341 [Pluteus cervinus]|uniref:Uncharacterized protein n=1 Tax=Pluteus cervinus TaxID=181527 RepID=A0ACD3BHW6_9AGAR|nr:hypothetical protein BDN72DRAFT_830341 [Pluteus cervinus]
MPSASSLQQSDFDPGPDLHPLYPSTPHIAVLLSSHSGLNPDQKAELVSHCLSRACAFAELPLLQHLLLDPQAQVHVDLNVRDDDGIGLVSLTIHGFGAESDRDVEREECVRLLVDQGADLSADNDGWTPLHHAALLSPPTLVSYLMTHKCSPFAVTRRNLTPLDIVTAHSMLPGRDAVALILETAMHGEGWDGGRMADNRKLMGVRLSRKRRQLELRHSIGKALNIPPRWWGNDADSSQSDLSDNEDEGEPIYTPPADYTTMLVFSPPELPQIFQSLITNYQPKFRDATPANTLYLLVRFAALTCDHSWLEDLILGATDTIEETFFNNAEDITCLVFWLYNATIWLHLMQCDNSINEVCEMLGSFEALEEAINSVFVFIIRYIERKVDQILDDTMLEYAPLGSDNGNVQFESEWSIFRPFGSIRKQPQTPAATLRNGPPASPPSPNRPLSPSQGISTSPRAFASLRQTFKRSQASTTPVMNIFPLANLPLSPANLTAFLTSLNMFFTLSDINPAMTTQLWSQVMYWTSCEIFNRVITRKKYLCRSKAVQIAMNLTSIEEWIDQTGLPHGVHLHLQPVKDLLSWLQCLSSVTEFPDLVSTIQGMKNINPLQMRRAVRDYKYEVNESKMNDECVQYLTQLQKDWERHRLKLGVEALRNAMTDRDRDRESTISSLVNDGSSKHSSSSNEIPPQQNIDLLFDPPEGDMNSAWEPIHPPQVLGELLDSRYMLPLLLPSDPRKLAAAPDIAEPAPTEPGHSRHSMQSDSSSQMSTSSRTRFKWKSKNCKIREVGIAALHRLDGGRTTVRWTRSLYSIDPAEANGVDDNGLVVISQEEAEMAKDAEDADTSITPLTRKPSSRIKGRASVGE